MKVLSLKKRILKRQKKLDWKTTKEKLITFYKQGTIGESRIHREVIWGANQNQESELDDLNVAYIEDTLTQDEDNNTLENEISTRRHIMTNDEIAAELEADYSKNSDFDESESD